MNIKAIAMAAASLCTAVWAPLAHAQSDYTDVAYAGIFWTGTMQVSQTTDLESAFDVASITYAATPGGGSVQTGTYDLSTSTGQTTWLQLLSASTKSTSSSTPVETVSAADAAITYTRKGQSVTVRNFELDAQRGTVYADIYSSEGSFKHESWLVMGNLSGTTGHPGSMEGEHSEGGFTGLVLSGDYLRGDATGALGIFNRGLGITGASRALLSGTSFANVSYSAVYLNGFYWPWELPPKASLVPEPSTYALIACGLASLMLVTRRQRMTI